MIARDGESDPPTVKDPTLASLQVLALHPGCTNPAVSYFAGCASWVLKPCPLPSHALFVALPKPGRSASVGKVSLSSRPARPIVGNSAFRCSFCKGSWTSQSITWNRHWNLRSGHVGWLQQSPSHNFESEAVTFVARSHVWQSPKFSIQPISTKFNKDIPVEKCRNPYQFLCERQKGWCCGV